MDQANEFYEQELTRLQNIVRLQNAENLQLEQKLTDFEEHSKQKYEELNLNFTSKLEQTLRKFQEGHKDKTSSLVMKYAEGEKKCIDLNRNIEFLKSKLDDSDKEKQRLNDRLDKSKQEILKLNNENERKLQEIMLLKKENEKLKENIVLSEAREKALKLTSDVQISLKNSIEQKVNKSKSSDEYCNTNESIRSDISSYLTTEHFSESIPVEIINELNTENLSNEKISASKLPQTFGNNKAVSHKDMFFKEFEALKSQLKEMFEERITLKESLQIIEKEKKLQEASIVKFKETLQLQKQMNKELLNEILQLRELEETLSK